jgi:hypothetical protein
MVILPIFLPSLRSLALDAELNGARDTGGGPVFPCSRHKTTRPVVAHVVSAVVGSSPFR